jgi:hypothetical protein
MPGLIDRARLASIAVMAAFVALSLAFVTHLADTGGPMPLPGEPGRGQVLLAPEGPSIAAGPTRLTPATLGAANPVSAVAAGASAAIAPGPGPGATAAAGSGSGGAAPAGAGSPGLPTTPETVGITIASGAPVPPSTAAPVPSIPVPPPLASSPGSGTAGTTPGHGEEEPPSGSEGNGEALPGEGVTDGHAPIVPPPAAPTTGASPSGAEGESGTASLPSGGSTAPGTGAGVPSEDSTAPEIAASVPTEDSTVPATSAGVPTGAMVPPAQPPPSGQPEGFPPAF